MTSNNFEKNERLVWKMAIQHVEPTATLNTNVQTRRFRVGCLQNQLLVHHFQKMHFTRPWPCETQFLGHRHFYSLFQKLTNVWGETLVFEKTDESPTTLNTNLQKRGFRVGRLHIQKMRAQSCKIVFFQGSSSCVAFAITETWQHKLCGVVNIRMIFHLQRCGWGTQRMIATPFSRSAPVDS